MFRIHTFFVAIVTFIWYSVPSSAADFEQYCNLPGFSSQVRQTIIILDEQHVFPEEGKPPEARNGPWRQFIGNLLFADTPTLERNFLPREHVTIFIARKDGAGARTVAAGRRRQAFVPALRWPIRKPGRCRLGQCHDHRLP